MKGTAIRNRTTLLIRVRTDSNPQTKERDHLVPYPQRVALYISMAKQQINFRIDQELLNAIKDRAKKEGIPYTHWIRNACASQLAVDPFITLDEEEMDVYEPTAIHYSASNIQYSNTTLHGDIQDWQNTGSQPHPIATEGTFPEAEVTVPKADSTLQAQINHLSQRLRWESQYRDTLETQVYYLKSMLMDAVAELEEKIALLEQQTQENSFGKTRDQKKKS